MIEKPPKEPRRAARVILIDGADRVLFFHAKEPASGASFWAMPGGGLDTGESFEDAALRETFEETGLSVRLGPYVWLRRHRYEWNGKPADQYERFFVARLEEDDIKMTGKRVDSYIIGHRWWNLDDLLASNADFAPRRVAELLGPILQGRYPPVPIDCGI